MRVVAVDRMGVVVLRFFRRRGSAPVQTATPVVPPAPVDPAVLIARERVEARRRAVRSDASSLPGLALALNELGISMSKAGDEAGALGATREALDIYRRLAQVDPEEFRPYLALTLNNLGLRLSATGHDQAALEPSREAVAIARRLAEEEPARLPDLASALNGLGTRLVQAGDESAGFGAIAEAVGIQRRLADEAPAAHLPKLAVMLNGLGARLMLAGDRDDAVVSLRQAVDIRRRMAESGATKDLSALAWSLRLAASIGDAHAIALDTSLSAVHESISIYQALAVQGSGASEDDLAEAERTRTMIVERLER